MRSGVSRQETKPLQYPRFVRVFRVVRDKLIL